MPTVLTVDDSRTMRDLLHDALSQAGFRVLQAADGIDGLAVLDRLAVLGGAQPDVIVTDINMPRLDGFGFIARVRAGRHRGTPILVLTTESDAAKKAAARRAGATGWIVKPFDAGRLIEAVRRVAA